MASLLVSAAVNIGVGLLLNFLFPPKGQDTRQEGPRLGDLTVTSSAYGQPINIGYGTVRMGGNIIWSPGIEEVVNVQTQEVGGKGGGGGGSATTTTYTYYCSFAMAFSEGVAADILRIWADGKLIYDKTGTGLSTDKGLKFRFYVGDEDQLPDALIEADKGAGNVSAHRGLCYMVAERWPLADYGNRVPQLTAEIAYDAVDLLPFTPLSVLSGVSLPGSSSGADGSSHMFLYPFNDSLYMFKDGGSGTTRSSVGTMTMTAVADVGPLSGSQDGSAYGLNDFVYVQNGSANYVPFRELNPDTLAETGRFFGGTGSVDLGGDFIFRNGANFGVHIVGAPELGVDPVEIFVVSGPGANASEGISLLYTDDTGTFIEDRRTSIGTSRRARFVMHDFFNKRTFVTLESDSVVDLYEIEASVNIGVFGTYVTPPDVNLIGTYNKGGSQYTGTADTTGWCFVPDEEALILSNATSMFKVDLNSGSVLATNLTLGFQGKNQWSTNGKLGFGNGVSGALANGIIYLVDTDDLTVLKTFDIGDAGFADSGEANYPEGAYDPRSNSYIFSRIHGVSPSGGQQIVRVLLDRADGVGEPLSDIVADISQRVGLDVSEFDVSDLTTETVRGYVINRVGPARTSLEPLMRGFLFEGAESDWKMKFVQRGAAPVLTVAEDDIGKLSTSATDEYIKEIRQQEIELPSIFGVLYSDVDQDYQQGRQQDKRVTLPVPTQRALNTIDVDLPIVFEATEAKQLAQRWLYTSWAERLSFNTVIPWKYIRLDPTDVFNVIYQGETRRMRMAEVDIGVDLAMEFSATQEDARSNDSGVVGSAGLGLIPQTIPSNLPTKLFLLDLPLLLAADASLQQFSRYYWAASGYDDGWPGALLYNSIDNGGSFQEIGSSSVQVAWGYVDGTLANPGTTTTWDESVTVDIKVLGGIDRFATSTDSDVLNGANALAVLRTDGTSEIIQFVNVTQIDNGTVRLSRLLRGRRGTEPLSTGHTSGEQVVLLESGRVKRGKLELNLLNVSTQFKGVTLSTLLEDNPTQNFTFTGQDLIPYSPVNVAGSVNGGGDLEVTFDRRTRFNGELMSGSGEIPLNEGSEAYEMDVRQTVDGAIIRVVEGTSETITYDFTQDFGVDAIFLTPMDADANDDSSVGATATVGSAVSIQGTTVKYGAGSAEFTPTSGSDANSRITWPDNAAYAIGSQAFTIEFWVRFKSLTAPYNVPIMLQQYNPNANDRGWFIQYNGNLRFVLYQDPGGSGDAVLDLQGAWSPATDTWYHLAFTRDGSGTVRSFADGTQIASGTYAGAVNDPAVVLGMGFALTSGGAASSLLNGFIDDARIVIGKAVYTANFTPPTEALTLGSTPSSLVVEVFQMSEIVGRGRGSGQTTITL